MIHVTSYKIICPRCAEKEQWGRGRSKKYGYMGPVTSPTIKESLPLVVGGEGLPVNMQVMTKILNTANAGPVGLGALLIYHEKDGP